MPIGLFYNTVKAVNYLLTYLVDVEDLFLPSSVTHDLDDSIRNTAHMHTSIIVQRRGNERFLLPCNLAYRDRIGLHVDRQAEDTPK